MRWTTAWWTLRKTALRRCSGRPRPSNQLLWLPSLLPSTAMWTTCATPPRPGCFWKSWRRSSFFPRPVGERFRLRLLFLLRHQRQRRLRLHPRPRQVVGSTSGNPSVLRGKLPRLQRRHLLLQNLNPKWHRSQPQNPNLFQRPNPWWSNSRNQNQNQHQNPNPNPRSLPRLLPSRSVRNGQPCARRLEARIRLPRLCSPKPVCWACATAP